MSISVIRRVIIFGAIIILGIIAMQSYWVMNTWNLKEQEFHQSVYIALQRVAKEIAGQNQTVLPPKELIKKISSNYYVVNVNSDIDAGALEYELVTAFQEQSLNADFEYAIHDCQTTEMVYGDFCQYSDTPINENTLGNLPQYDEFTYYFGVKFPAQAGYLLSRMQTSVLLTIILFFTIAFFIYSMYIILSQQRLSEMQKDFINNMTHEFKTPISTIKISADVFLKSEKIKEDTRLNRYASIIKEQNERLNTQVEKVLQIARLERDNFKLKKEEVDLHKILNQTLDSVDLEISSKQGVISTNLTAQNAILSADKLHLTNILYNLIDNAVKYCQKSPEISISTKNIGNAIQLCIADKGIGISKEFQSKVFNKFYRVPTGNVHNVKGFGLGLFYIKNICDAHAWKLQLKSEPNVGTEILINMKTVAI